MTDTCSVRSDIVIGNADEECGKMLVNEGFTVFLVKTCKLIGWEIIVLVAEQLYKLSSLCVCNSIRNKVGEAAVFITEEVDNTLVILHEADCGILVPFLMVLHDLIDSLKLIVYLNGNVESTVSSFLGLACTGIHILLTVEGEAELHEVHVVAALVSKCKVVFHDGVEFVTTYLEHDFSTLELCAEQVKLKNLEVTVIVLDFEAEVVWLERKPFNVQEYALCTDTETAFSCAWRVTFTTAEAEVVENLFHGKAHFIVGKAYLMLVCGEVQKNLDILCFIVTAEGVL